MLHCTTGRQFSGPIEPYPEWRSTARHLLGRQMHHILYLKSTTVSPGPMSVI